LAILKIEWVRPFLFFGVALAVRSPFAVLLAAAQVGVLKIWPVEWIDMAICFGIALGQYLWSAVFEMIPERFFVKTGNQVKEENVN
jgi:hypothetical protein